MTRHNISSGSEFEAKIGYSRAVVCHPWVIVSGTTGYDYATGVLPPDVTSQTRNIISTVSTTLASAGADPSDIVRVRYILPNKADFPTIWPLLREFFGLARPAATMLEAGLMEDAMKIEIEVTAMIGAGPTDVPPPA
ncbi:related to brt1 protein [Cephalotrichum gorgonifer]|uniref:Related to brt1 protein n=1 Tax=Cephalotrichum gorgonifer TaxID=2041049 RepID=A0AAE8SYJ1_9PEZI|nr:related to brt1 protein [Cephalotrichum gorgonifer]